MKVKWFVAGWLGHSVAMYVAERIRAHREWLTFEREIRREGKRMGEQIAGYRDAKG
jgi:hypothetical protein